MPGRWPSASTTGCRKRGITWAGVPACLTVRFRARHAKALAWAITGQQISVAAAAVAVRRGRQALHDAADALAAPLPLRTRGP
jgi:hypothetical protein